MSMVTGATTSIRIYNAIKEACLEMTEVKQFALWNNQTEKAKDGDGKLNRFPACYVQFQNEYNQLSAGRQEINGTFILYICLQSLEHNDEYILRFKDSVYQQLAYNLPSKGFGDFYRVFELQDVDRDNVLVWQQEYSYKYIDDVAKDVVRSVHPFDINYQTHH